MATSNLVRLVPILLGTACLAGCATNSQPVAQAGSAKKEKQYYSEESPATGSHIPRRYSPDDMTAASANNVENVSADAIQPTRFNPAKNN